MTTDTQIQELDLLSQLLIREQEIKDLEEETQLQKEVEEYNKNLKVIKITLPSSLAKFQTINKQ